MALALAAILAITALAGCKGSSHGRDSGSRDSGSFAWLKPTPPPRGWSIATISNGATLPYPPGWRRIKSDPGSATVALLGSGQRIVGYLNATPKQGPETLENWASFRPDHNRDEGDTNDHLVASGSDLPFPGGRGSCVIDDYTTSKATYREIACLVSGSRSTAVVVAAAPTDRWDAQLPTLRRAVSGFTS